MLTLKACDMIFLPENGLAHVMHVVKNFTHPQKKSILRTGFIIQEIFVVGVINETK
jgi:hypothetical protein